MNGRGHVGYQQPYQQGYGRSNNGYGRDGYTAMGRGGGVMPVHDHHRPASHRPASAHMNTRGGGGGGGGGGYRGHAVMRGGIPGRGGGHVGYMGFGGVVPPSQLLQQQQQQRLWGEPRKESAFVLLTRPDGAIYTVRFHDQGLGLPGGRRLVTDATLWTTASREFKEETKQQIPRGREFGHFEWFDADSQACLRIYHGELSEGLAEQLHTGPSRDRSVAEVLWVPAPKNEEERSRFRPHIRTAIKLRNVLVEQEVGCVRTPNAHISCGSSNGGGGAEGTVGAGTTGDPYGAATATAAAAAKAGEKGADGSAGDTGKDSPDSAIASGASSVPEVAAGEGGEEEDEDA